jgi:hypothetical protein
MREQEVRELYEAYRQVHQPQEEVEQLDEAREANRDPEGYEARQRTSQSSRQRRMNDPHTGINSPAFHAFMAQQTGGTNKKKVEEETDLFDTILEHLVAEGYADTNEAALAIMANMSEGWRESIVEEVLDEALTGERLQRAQEIIARDPKSPKAKDVKRVADSQEGSDRNDTTPGDLPRDRSNTTLPTGRGGRGRKGLGKTTNRPGRGAPLGGRTAESDRGREAFNR